MSMEEDWKALKRLKKTLPKSLFEQGKDSNTASSKAGKPKGGKEKPLKKEANDEDKITVNELKEKLRRKILELRQNGAGKEGNPEGVVKKSKKIKKKGKNNGKAQEGKKTMGENERKNQGDNEKKGRKEGKKQKKPEKIEKKPRIQGKHQTNGGQVPSKGGIVTEKAPKAKERKNRPGFEGKKSSFF